MDYCAKGSTGDSKFPENVDILIIGAGPTGLGAATRLHQLNHDDWLIIDQSEYAGGLACTDVTKEGFLFDLGGHVIFSHYDYFGQLLDAAVGTGELYWAVHQRVSYVRIRNRWVSYPFQNNISKLDIDDQVRCINGLIDASIESAKVKDRPKNFDEWILRVMGEGIANIFMRPYNYKVWAVPTTRMQCDWLGERVATVDVKKVISNVLHDKEEGGWGPNAVFRFPQNGGTGGIWKAVAKLLPEKRQYYGAKVIEMDCNEKFVILDNGHRINFNRCISTMPLDYTLQLIGQSDLGEGLFHSSSHIIGIGLRGHNPHELKCWMYFPEDNCPFYRCTIFSHYANNNVPSQDTLLSTIRTCDFNLTCDSTQRPGPYWSLMFEISESSMKKPLPNHDLEQTQELIIQETIQGAINTGLVQGSDEIVSIYYQRLEYGYPVPTLERDNAINRALPFLKQHSIWSRGRFGSYKYEVANQDHSLMLGVEAVNNILFSAPELTLQLPNFVNAPENRNQDLVFQLPN